MISVVIPTYKRPHLLKRAVESVFSQTWNDWELVVSDDEDPPGESWGYLLDLASRDGRVKATRNSGRHGQAGNLNHGMGLCRGEWIKPLFDDDVLLPNCLEAFAKAVAARPNVALAGCLAKRYVGGAYRRTDPAYARSAAEVTPQRYAHLAMYLQDAECGGMPTQMLVNARAVHAGAIMPDDDRYVSAIDQVWFAEILRHGDRLHLPLPLVEEHQGGHETVTRGASRPALDRDNLLLREHLYPLIPADVPRPSLPVINDMVLAIRGLHRLTGGHVGEGLRLLASVRNPAAAWLAMKWLLRKLFPGHFAATLRLRYSN